MKEEPLFIKRPSSRGEHIVLLLTHKYFQCTCFNFLFIKWKECGAIKCILKKSIHSILYITHKGKWRFAFQQHIYWFDLLLIWSVLVFVSFSSYCHLVPQLESKVYNVIKFRILGERGGKKYHLKCETWPKFTTFIHLITVFLIILSLFIRNTAQHGVTAIPELSINPNYIPINTKQPLT